ncbi:MAG: hypothetical protein ABI609_12685 [Acidobacteriota bacterium]
MFHADRTLDHWRWKYRDDPFGGTHISLVFASDGELVAHYAGYVVPFVDRREGHRPDFVGLHIGDTMTHPSYRHIGRGPTSLLARAVAHFYAHSSEQRVAFNYGFNTGNIQRFSVRFLRLQHLEDITAWTLGADAAMPREPSAYEIERVTEVSGEWDELFESAAVHYGVLVRRDARYVRWRYLECPDRHHRIYGVRLRGRLVGWGAFRPIDADQVCGDAFFERDHAQAAGPLIDHVRSTAPQAALTLWSPRRPAWWIETLTNLGFTAGPEPHDLALMAVPFLVQEPARDLVPGLFYSRGDGDLF